MLEVKEHIARTAHVGDLEEYRYMYRESLDHPGRFWRRQARRLTWFHEPEFIHDNDPDEVDFSWPVLSVSLGDEGLFRVGNIERGGTTESIWLKSVMIPVSEVTVLLCTRFINKRVS